MAEDIGFHAEDLSLLLDSFSSSFFGSETFYQTAQSLALKFKYTLSDSDLVKILRATVMAKHKPNEDLVNLLNGVNRSELPACSLQQAYDFVTLNLEISMPGKNEDLGYVERKG